MDRSELARVCERVLGGGGGAKEVEVIALALQRYLVGEGRRKRFDKRAYQREYMARYRTAGRHLRVRRGRGRK